MVKGNVRSQPSIHDFGTFLTMKLLKWTRRYRRYRRHYSQLDANMQRVDSAIIVGKVVLCLSCLVLLVFIATQLR